MIVEYLRYTIDEARQSKFIEDYKKAAFSLLNSPYCHQYDFCQCVEDSSKFIIRIEWSSADDHLKLFRQSDDFKNFLPHIRAYINDIEEMRHYEKLSD